MKDLYVTMVIDHDANVKNQGQELGFEGQRFGQGHPYLLCRESRKTVEL